MLSADGVASCCLLLTSRGDGARAKRKGTSITWGMPCHGIRVANYCSQMNTPSSPVHPAFLPWERELEAGTHLVTFAILEPRPVLSDTLRHGCVGSGWVSANHGRAMRCRCVLSSSSPTPLHACTAETDWGRLLRPRASAAGRLGSATATAQAVARLTELMGWAASDRWTPSMLASIITVQERIMDVHQLAQEQSNTTSIEQVQAMSIAM
jgi:hypothetical protein